MASTSSTTSTSGCPASTGSSATSRRSAVGDSASTRRRSTRSRSRSRSRSCSRSPSTCRRARSRSPGRGAGSVVGARPRGRRVGTTISRTIVVMLIVMLVVGLVLRGDRCSGSGRLLLLLPSSIHFVAPGAIGGIYKAFFPREGLVGDSAGVRARAARADSRTSCPGSTFWSEPAGRSVTASATRFRPPTKSRSPGQAPTTSIFDNQYLDALVKLGARRPRRHAPLLLAEVRSRSSAARGGPQGAPSNLLAACAVSALRLRGFALPLRCLRLRPGDARRRPDHWPRLPGDGALEAQRTVGSTGRRTLMRRFVTPDSRADPRRTRRRCRRRCSPASSRADRDGPQPRPSRSVGATPSCSRTRARRQHALLIPRLERRRPTCQQQERSPGVRRSRGQRTPSVSGSATRRSTGAVTVDVSG